LSGGFPFGAVKLVQIGSGTAGADNYFRQQPFGAVAFGSLVHVTTTLPNFKRCINFFFFRGAGQCVVAAN